MRHSKLLTTLMMFCICTCLAGDTNGNRLPKTGRQNILTIICSENAPANIKLAAREVRRYVYLRTGQLLPILESASGNKVSFNIDKTLEEQQYKLESDRKSLEISGGSEVAVLYGTYAFAEKLGVRFEISGDVIPDEKIPLTLSVFSETHKPLFGLRGIQPFHDFMEGPDWWNVDDYKSIASQMIKMKMNFIGFHSYPWFKPWKHVPPEPGVWIGLPGDVDADGNVKFSYPASWANTLRPGPGTNHAWGHLPGKTGDFSAGASQLFDRDDYGAEVMRGLTPWPKTTEDCNLLFNRVGNMFGDAFGFSRSLGVKVCVGLETPLWVPDELREKIKKQGKNPDDPATLRELCQGMFTRIFRSHPIDYFWLWTPERELDPEKTKSDLIMINEVAREMNLPVGTAVCGWGWIAHQFENFDKTLPKNIAFSCINDRLGFAPVTVEFEKIQERDGWCIPWMEDDTDLTAPQLFAGRVRKDASDALKMGCKGLMGIHWRTRVIAPSLDMLAICGWKEFDNNGELRDVLGSEGTIKPLNHPNRAMPVSDFYADWCHSQFGGGVGSKAAVIFSEMDGRMPRPACWALDGKYGQSAGPGVIGDADSRPWEIVAKEYAFVDELAILRPLVTGAGNLERFDYWLGQFQYIKAMGKLRCSRYDLEQAVNQAEKATVKERLAAVDVALSWRRQLVADWVKMMTLMLETVNSPGELGTVANLELHTRLSAGYLNSFDTRLELLMGKPLPEDQIIPTGYMGKSRIIVPTVRTIVERGEALNLTILAMDKQPVKSVAVQIRPLGKGKWKTAEAKHIARAVWNATLPAATEDFEYQIVAKTSTGAKLVWPATAPVINQTVVLKE